MYCTKCGKEIPEGEKKVCDECQQKILNEIALEEKQNEEIKSEEEKGTTSKKDKKVKKDKKEKKTKEDKKRKKDNENVEEKQQGKSTKIIKWVCIVLICFSIAIIAFCVITALRSALQVNNVGNTIGNIRNYGYASKQGNWIYYLSPTEDTSKISIFKIKNDGTKKQELLSTDSDIVSLNVSGKYIYFIGATTEETEEQVEEIDNKIYRMKLDGSDLEVINDNEFNDNCYEIYVINDEVYYIGENAEICKMNSDGSNKTSITNNDTGYLGITENYIIYNKTENEESTDYTTYVMNIDGTNERPVIENKRLYSVNIEGDYIYYTNSDKKIYKTKVDSNTEELVCDVEAYNLNIKDGYAYYLSYLDVEKEDYTVCVFRIKLDGTSSPEKIKELDTYSSFINVIGDWVIYMDTNQESGFINLVKTDGSGEIVQLYLLNFEDVRNKQLEDNSSNVIDDTTNTTDTDTSNNTQNNTNENSNETPTNENTNTVQ